MDQDNQFNAVPEEGVPAPALDAQTEVQVLKNLKKLPEKTILIVTHRPAALEICNRIFEVKDRKMTEKDKKT